MLATAAALPFVVLLGVALAAEASGALAPAAASPLTACGSAPVKPGVGADGRPALNATQIGDAQIIYTVAAPGDLLFSAGSDGTAANPGHVGMYIGSGLVIEAPQTGEPVMITPLAGCRQQNTVAIRRIV